MTTAEKALQISRELGIDPISMIQIADCMERGQESHAYGMYGHSAELLRALISTLEKLEQAEADIHNLNSSAHAICKENLTETLAAALESHQRAEQAEAKTAKLEHELERMADMLNITSAGVEVRSAVQVTEHAQEQSR